MFFFDINKMYITYFFLKSLFIVVILIFSGALVTVFERKLLGLFQNRYGPNRVGWYGSLQLFADMIKIFFKQDWIPNFSNRFIFNLSPIIAFICLPLVICSIPFSCSLYISNFKIGILFFFMMSGLSVYSILFAGWSSNNKYALLGSIRSCAQILSYEIFLGLSILGVIARSGSFNLIDIVNSQYYIWNIIPQFFGFLNFLIASLAICHRHPFDQPESEQELADGYHIEYSGIKFGLFFIGEYVSIIIISMLTVILFFGGWIGPYYSNALCFFFKTFLFLCFIILIRAAIPRPKYNQVLLFGWKICLPLSLLNIFLTAFILLSLFDK